MLKTYQSTEKYIVENGVCYAVCEELNRKRKVDGCEVRNELAAEYAGYSDRLKELEAETLAVKKKMSANKTLDSQLSVAGYCALDKPVYKKLEGLVVKDSAGNPVITAYTHSDVCERKGG